MSLISSDMAPGTERAGPLCAVVAQGPSHSVKRRTGPGYGVLAGMSSRPSKPEGNYNLPQTAVTKLFQPAGSPPPAAELVRARGTTYGLDRTIYAPRGYVIRETLESHGIIAVKCMEGVLAWGDTGSTCWGRSLEG